MFLYAMQSKKGPAEAEPHFSVPQNPFAKERVFELITGGLDDVPLL